MPKSDKFPESDAGRIIPRGWKEYYEEHIEAPQEEQEALEREAKGLFWGKYSEQGVDNLDRAIRELEAKPDRTEPEFKRLQDLRGLRQLLEDRRKKDIDDMFWKRVKRFERQQELKKEQEQGQAKPPSKLGGPKDEEIKPPNKRPDPQFASAFSREGLNEAAAVPLAAIHALAVRPYQAAKTLLSPGGQYRPGEQDPEGVALGMQAAGAAVPGALKPMGARAGKALGITPDLPPEILNAPNAPVPPQQVLQFLKAAGAENVQVQVKGPDRTIYIKFQAPGNPKLRHEPTPEVRIPTDPEQHGAPAYSKGNQGAAARVGSQFDTGTSWRTKRMKEPGTTQNVAGEPFSELENLFAALKWKLSSSPDGQFLISPDQAPARVKTMPGIDEPPPGIKKKPEADPRQLQLLSSSTPGQSKKEQKDLALPLNWETQFSASEEQGVLPQYVPAPGYRPDIWGTDPIKGSKKTPPQPQIKSLEEFYMIVPEAPRK
jgi:hypothetical protein